MVSTHYPPKINSPATTLTAAITISATTIPVADLSVFPTGPNLATLGTGINAETVVYAAKSATTGAGNLTGCTRAFQSPALAWPISTVTGRSLSAYDITTLQTDVQALAARLPMYYATIYQSGLYSLAVDSSGNLLSQVTIASQNDDAPIQAAINSCPTGATIALTGAFTIRNSVQGTTSLELRGISPCSITCLSSVASTAFSFTAFGNAKASTTIKAATPAVAQNNFLKVTTYANIAVGDILIVKDSTTFANTNSVTKGEGVKVLSKTAPDRVNLYDALISGYAAGGGVEIYTPITVRIEGITFSAASQEQDIFQVAFQYCIDSSFKNNIIPTAGTFGLYMSCCYNFMASGNKIYNAKLDNAGIGVAGYGIEYEGGCRNIFIVDNTIENCRHCIAGGGTDAESVNVVIERNQMTTGAPATSTTGMQCVDAHVVWSVYIKNNVMTKSWNATDYSTDPNSPACVLGVKYGIIEHNECYGFDGIFADREGVTNMNVVIKHNDFYANPNAASNNTQICFVLVNDNSESQSYDTLVLEGNEIWGAPIGYFETVPISELVLLNNKMHSNSAAHQAIAGSDGIFINGYSNIRVEGNTTTNTGGNGINIVDSIGTLCRNRVIQPARANTAGGRDGILLVQTGTNTLRLLAEGNMISSTNYMEVGIEEYLANNAYGFVTYANNVINGATNFIQPYQITGTGSHGVLFSGFATSVADGGTITHGLIGLAPRWVLANSAIATQGVSPTTLGTATFTVAVKKFDNSAGTTGTIYYQGGM